METQNPLKKNGSSVCVCSTNKQKPRIPLKRMDPLCVYTTNKSVTYLIRVLNGFMT